MLIFDSESMRERSLHALPSKSFHVRLFRTYHLKKREFAEYNRQAIFACGEDIKAYVYWLREYAEKFDVSIHAWVFMTNHAHLLGRGKYKQSEEGKKSGAESSINLILL